MPENLADRAMEELNARIAAELDELGRAITDDLLRMISVPVEYAGSYAIRSSPGEPPRRETGGLARSIRYQVRRGDGGPDVTTLSVFSDSPVAQYLEYGTTRGLARRPFFQPIFEKWAPVVIERVAGSALRVGSPT